jgi:hypothetical protein
MMAIAGNPNAGTIHSLKIDQASVPTRMGRHDRDILRVRPISSALAGKAAYREE